MPTCYRLGLIGYPLGHSFSPQLHQAALQGAGLEGDYCLYPIQPLPAGLDDLQALLAQVRQGQIHGLNVTIPHKASVISHLDRLTPIAAAVGAVNTIFCSGGELIGDNTDVPGFLSDLATAGVTEPSGPAIVLGAGGAARAVAFGLADHGWGVIIAARRMEQAADLAQSLQDHISTEGRLFVTTLDLTGLQAYPGKAALVVNTTPVGMAPNTGASPWPAELPLPSGAFCYDTVYNPLQTQLLQQATGQGLQTRNGLGMLVAQAALAFAIWTGVKDAHQWMNAVLPDISSHLNRG